MKPKIILLTLLLIASLTMQSFAMEIPGYEGGIKNELTYKEVIFITGEPILMEGTLSRTITSKGNNIIEKYSYRLTNTAKEAKLSRTLTLTREQQVQGDQRIENVSVSSFKETIDIGRDKYLVDQSTNQWSKSDIYHQKPGVGYFAGNWTGRRTYTINRTGGKVTVETEGISVGYDQNWGTTETQTLEHFIQYERTGDTPIKWQGRATVEAVHNRTKDYAYMANTPSQISFSGGYVLTEQQENVLKYSYDLPRFNEDGTIKSQRNLGSSSLGLETSPTNERLNIPSMRDVQGHWAEKDILFLASIQAIYPNSTNFGPSLPMSRGDFARAMAIIMDVRKEEPPAPRRGTPVEEKAPSFVDVSKEESNQKYIEAIYERGIMEGVGSDRFYPNQSLTKVQAITVLVRALGFENLEPLYSYSTGFRDDNEIPDWAKGSVYVAKELGLVSGTPDGYIQPNKAMTKAEATTMLVNFISYLQKGFRYDYRERILNR